MAHENRDFRRYLVCLYCRPACNVSAPPMPLPTLSCGISYTPCRTLYGKDPFRVATLFYSFKCLSKTEHERRELHETAKEITVNTVLWWSCVTIALSGSLSFQSIWFDKHLHFRPRSVSPSLRTALKLEAIFVPPRGDSKTLRNMHTFVDRDCGIPRKCFNSISLQ